VIRGAAFSRFPCTRISASAFTTTETAEGGKFGTLLAALDDNDCQDSVLFGAFFLASEMKLAPLSQDPRQSDWQGIPYIRNYDYDVISICPKLPRE